MAHELGHNLNMKHDYLEEITATGNFGIRYDSRGQRCSYLQTIMDTQVDFFDEYKECIFLIIITNFSLIQCLSIGVVHSKICQFVVQRWLLAKVWLYTLQASNYFINCYTDVLWHLKRRLKTTEQSFLQLSTKFLTEKC